jgi:hypothetical protein
MSVTSTSTIRSVSSRARPVRAVSVTAQRIWQEQTERIASTYEPPQWETITYYWNGNPRREVPSAYPYEHTHVKDSGYSKSVASISTTSVAQQDHDIIHPVAKIVLSVLGTALVSVIVITTYLCGMPYIYHMIMTSTSGDATLDLVLPMVVCVVMPVVAATALTAWMYTKMKNYDKEKVEYHDWKW